MGGKSTLTGYMMNRRTLLAIPLTCVAVTALAHGGATGIVKERMDQMGSVSKAMKSIGAMMKGAEPYDAERVRMLAAGIGQMGGDRLTGLFPEGSMDAPTEARAEIWTDWERFQQQATEMETVANALADQAGQPRSKADPQSPDALFLALGATCKACHQDFRIKK